MEFICLGSSSAGNSYLFVEGQHKVIVECGFEFSKILQKLHSYNSTLGEIEAVITTHAHSDHSMSIENFKTMGIPTFTPWQNKEYETFIQITDWLYVYCFPCSHDVESCGFFFYNNISNEGILFINDTHTFELPKDIKKVKFDFIFIECNHIRKQLEAIKAEAILNGNQGKVFKYERQANYHLSLAGTKKMLKQLDLSNTKGIFLMHLSKECANDVVMKKEIETVYKVPTFVCGRVGGLL